MNKKCGRCKALKITSCFYPDTRTKDKLKWECIECCKTGIKNWQKNNVEKVKEAKRRWDSSEKGKEWNRIYWQNYKINYKPKRLTGPKKMRFDVLHRDKFTCRYCGRSAPDVILQVDHIFPKSKGGSNTLENLITSCVDCNIGKKDMIL